MALSDRIRLVGGAHTDVGILPEMSNIELQATAALRALEDAGLTPRDIDGLVVQVPYSRPLFFNAESLAEYLGTPVKHTQTSAGGAVGCSMLATAAGWIATGQARAVLCVYGDLALSASRGVTGFGSVPGMAMEEMEKAYGAFAAPINYGQLAQRYLHCYGYTEEALGAVALTEREHAALYPPAIRKDPLTMADYLASRPIASPLKTLDCAIINDGAGAFIVADRSVARDTRRPEIALLGIGARSTHWQLSQMPDLDMPGIAESGAQAYEMAGLTARDVDVAELYDCFTIVVPLQLEGLGFCERGEGGRYVMDGNIKLGARCPVNTYGGLLSCAHLADMIGMVEAMNQLSGEAGPRQVPNARVAMVTAIAGWVSTHCTALFGRV